MKTVKNYINNTEKGDSIKNLLNKAKDSVKKNFLFATLNFLFINLFIQLNSRIFGAENSIIGVIMTILMGICAGRDVSKAPLKNFLVQTFVFTGMAVAACFSVALGPWIAIPINLFVIFLIVYSYTYEYSNHLYFPYLLSYLFMLFITPVTPTALPTRLLCVVASSACMILYALALGYRNIKKPAKKTLCKLFDEAAACAILMSEGSPVPDNELKVRKIMHELSEIADKCRRGTFDLPESACDLLDMGRGIEQIILYMHDGIWKDDKHIDTFNKLAEVLNSFSTCIKNKSAAITEPSGDVFLYNENTRKLYEMLLYVRKKFACYTLNDYGKPKRDYAKKTSAARLKSALGFSTMRLAYSLRVTLLLTVFIIPVQFLHLPHGKWLIFTLASVSLPYAEDVMPKGLKRLLATVIGGAAAMVCFALIPDSTARVCLMMASGYLSFYFAGYTGNYACATFGALGGAAMSVLGWTDAAALYGIRLGYIILGIIIAYAVNVLLLPFHRRKASESIFKKYDVTARMIAHNAFQPDGALYYGLIIENNLLEQKLMTNAEHSGTKDIFKLTSQYQKGILKANYITRRNKSADHDSIPGKAS